MDRYDTVIVGSGFAGAILARVLRARGLEVLLVERARHPRFALGESSTPLASLSLERLAARHGLEDLRHLAAYGRWCRHLPHLRRGKKRGFTFFHHRSGERYRNSADNEARLLVAASPDDAIADAHWLRADVDAHLVQRACEEGVHFRDQTSVESVARDRGSWHLSLRRQNRVAVAAADTLVDASGPNGFLSRAFALGSAPVHPTLASGLLYGHLGGLEPFAAVAARHDATLDAGPYPDDRAAVHHLLDEGWMYQLPFDHGTASVGLVLRPQAGRALDDPPGVWRQVLARYPSLAAQLAPARPLDALRWIPRIQHRRTHAAGDGWFLLPHAFAFIDPMFSTGMAWSLLAVERLADLLTRPEGARAARAERAEAYARLLGREADQIERLIAAAYAAQPDFARFVAVAFLYFATVAYAECRQRLRPAADDAWQGFLGAGVTSRETLFEEACDFVHRAGPDPAATTAFVAWIAERIAPFDVVGLADARRRNLYPVDLEILVERSARLGLDRAEIIAALPRLRGIGEVAGVV